MIAKPAVGVIGSIVMQSAYHFTLIDANCVKDIISGEESISTMSLSDILHSQLVR